jgi:NO-binding membrane sensor protein with MHYT domain
MKPALWPILTGFSLWALAFIGLYALQYLGCYLGWDPALHRLALIAGYILAILLLLGELAIRLRLMRQGNSRATLDRIGLGTSIAALLATAITLAPALFVSACL